MPTSARDQPLTIAFYEGHIRPEFVRIHEQFSEMKRKMNQSDERFDFLFKKYEDFQQELTVIGHQLKRMDFRLDKIEGRLENLENTLNDHGLHLKDLRSRISKIETQQAQILTEIQFKRISPRRPSPSNQEIEQNLSQLRKEIAKINQEINELKSHLPLEQNDD